MMLRSILSAVDFSEQSRHALRWAGELATRFQARLTVLNVVDPLLAEAVSIRLGHDRAKAEAESALRNFVAATWPDGTAPAPTTVKTSIGNPAAVILEAAKEDDVDLIVMGTQGLGGFRKWLLGSTTERLLRQTHIPVLTVPMADESAVPQLSAAFETTRVLAATDFSESSIGAVTYAAELARRFSARLALAHAVEPLTFPPQWLPLVEESDERRVAEARDRLKVFAAQHCGPHECDAVASPGRPADVIGAIADDSGAQLIVMGLSNDEGPLAPRPGSIAYRVLCSTTVPVLVVPSSHN